MAAITPFRGLRYTSRDVNDLFAPPYDVVDKTDKERLCAKSPHNIAHLDLTDPGDPETYAKKAALLKQWIKDGVLVEDEAPCLYVLRQSFEDVQPNGQRQLVERWAVTCCVRIEDYEARVILPHERTLSGPKADRLKLMESTLANLSQVMGLYQGGTALTEDFRQLAKAAPDHACTDPVGVVNELWVVRDEAFIAKAVALLKDKQVLIADGHHRYETSRAFRDKAPSLGLGEDARYMTFSLVDGDDAGVVLYPIHRWLTKEALAAVPDWRGKLGGLFTVETLEALPEDAHRALRGAQSLPGDPVFIVVQRGEQPLKLTIDQATIEKLDSIPIHLRGLDTCVLQGALFKEVFGLTPEDIAAEKGVGYLKDFTALDNLLDQPQVGAVVLCRPTPLPLVMDLARQGVVLPQKSTFFYPKLPTGLTLRLIR